eukprot:5949297-Pyramimonas_sp.AAC.1
MSGTQAMMASDDDARRGATIQRRNCRGYHRGTVKLYSIWRYSCSAGRRRAPNPREVVDGGHKQP